ncbi:alpha-N-arabinofuranosidase II precursor [Bombardia bombarda]|uniref:non-reducing end alpha-L-arabinofuranosidase n=1 Tax=Bombardia bombarda TaxID=252184 RepID=A0AA40CH45_9PEZI|nr:alpha-N-arabinofuranosidase II precursor [Bombardia bombarda]
MARSLRGLVTATAAVIISTVLFLHTAPATAAATTSPAVSYTNPLVPQRADPHVMKHTDGYYYFTATVPAYDKIILRRAQTIQGLSSAPETTIWTRKASGVGSGQVWAPELHRIDNKWYVYVALGVSGQWKIRPFVLEGTGDNPLTASWTEKGVIKTNWDTFSLDASTFVSADGTRYLIWAQQEPSRSDENSSIMIAPLANPWTIRGTAVAISRPELAWERIGYKVNEGPFVIQRSGKIFLTYSASATDYNYCMGMLAASASADLMKASSWSKSSVPIFASNSNTSQYGPGHNSFVPSEDGLSDVMVYHDRSYRDITGDPLNDPNRRTRVQKLYWKADGTPDFGIPVPEGKTPVRLRSAADSNPARYVRLRAASTSLAETQFRIVSPGLGGASGSVSLESTSSPGVYLRRAGTKVQFEAGSSASPASFKTEASFTQRAGLSDSQGISLEATGAAGQFLALDKDGNLVLSAAGDVAVQAQATFFLE